MSVVVAGREGLTAPLLTEDYLSMREHALQLGQPQEEPELDIREYAELECGPEGPDCTGPGPEHNPERSASADDMLEQSKRESVGRLQYGCTHYKRRCRLRAPCCGEIFDCRHCHNEVKNMNEPDTTERHDLPRHLVESVICAICSTEQEVRQFCKSCGVCMGEYFCGTCKFFDDETTKRQYHCDECGICRVGGRDKFFHCKRCGCCYSTILQDGHPCVENSMHHNCPVCFEYLFDSMKDITVMPCGHTMHLECREDLSKHSQFSCPICYKSIWDMTKIWEELDEEVAATPMPEAYQNKIVRILCNDCGATSDVQFHIIAHKCTRCNSYNTKQTRDGPPGPPVGLSRLDIE